MKTKNVRAGVWSLLAALFLICANPLEMKAQTAPAGYSLSGIGSGWNQPIGAAFNKTGSRLFVWEKAGRVYVCNWNTTTGTYDKQATAVLDISPEVGDWRDHGLLGFALDPNFETNGFIYLLYVVDRHHLMNFGTASYSSTANTYYQATIGRITRYKTSTNASSQLIADPASRFVLLGDTKSSGFPILFESHGVGTLAFAMDGTLLASCGDGASYIDSDKGGLSYTYQNQAITDGIIRANDDVGAYRAQLLDCMDGKLIRIDPATGNGVPSNPFYNAAAPRSARSRVWALGLRNPFKFSFRPNSGSTDPSIGDIGEIFLGDVGYNNYEEITVIKEPASNLGWPIFEGITTSSVLDYGNLVVPNKDEPNPLFGINGCTQQYFNFQDLIKQATADGVTTVYNPCNRSTPISGGNPNRFFHRVPTLEWSHNAASTRVKTFSGNTLQPAEIGTTASGVTGSPFQANCTVNGTWYTGNMFPANYKNTFFFADFGRNWIKNMTVQYTDQITSVTNFMTGFVAIVQVLENPLDGSLLCVDVGANTITRVRYGGNQPPAAKITVDKNFGVSPLTVSFNGSGSYDPEGGALTYTWDFGDGTPQATTAAVGHTFTTSNTLPRKYVVKLTVRDNQNAVSTDSVIISANNTPPVVNITSPVKNSSYIVGPDSVYALRATVTDAEHSSGQLFYQWQSILHHNTHNHAEPIDTNKNTSALVSRVGCNGETFYWEFRLKVTDAAGLSTIDSSFIYPACATAPPVIASNPQSQTVCEGTTVTFTSAVSDPQVPAAQWQYSTNGGGTWTNIVGAIGGTYSFTAAAADNGKQYRIIWTNNIGSTTSTSATLTVKASPSAPTGSATFTYCTSATIASLPATGTSIKWYPVATGGTPFATTTIQLVSGTHYYASQTVNGCESQTRLDVTAILNPASNTTITLDGSRTTGIITSYQWTLLSGPNNPIIATPAAVTSTVSGLIKGTYIFQLSVNGGVSTSKVLVNINPSDTPIVAHAGFDRSVTLPASSVLLDGSGSTGLIATYQWSLVSGPNTPVISTPAAVSTNVSGLVQGTYSFSLSIKDNANNIRRDTVLITVNAAANGGTPPVIALTSKQTATGNTVVNSLTAVPAGALLVLTVAEANDLNIGANATISSSPALTWTKRADASATISGNAELYTAVFTAGGNISITSTWGSGPRSAVAYAITNYDAAMTGASAAVSAQASPSLAISTTRANSLLVGLTCDWKAIDGATRVYRDAATEILYHFLSGLYTAYHFTKQTAAVGTYTEGLSAPGGQAAGTVLYEILGPAGPPPSPIADASYNKTFTMAVAPLGPAVQTFCNNATVANLSASGNQIKWYPLSSGGTVLPASTSLVNASHYYASQVVSGCESVARLDVTVSINTPPPAPVITTSQNCDGTMVLSTNAAGSLLWSNGATTPSTTVNASGTYSVTVTNSSGCKATGTISVTVSLTGYSARIDSKSNVLCYGGSTGAFSLTASGGVTPYAFSLDNTSYQSSGVFLGLPAGTYTVYVKDGSGCVTTLNTAITQPETALGANTTVVDVSVYGAETGSVTASGTGSTPPYQYKLDTLAYGTSGIFTGLVAGNYTLSVKDANGCEYTKIVAISQPPDNLSCVNNTWLGGVSTAWENPLNWGCGTVPTSSSNVTINGGTLYSPIISSNVVIKSLTLNNGSSIVVSGTYKLKILQGK